jgi:hypothetical protein
VVASDEWTAVEIIEWLAKLGIGPGLAVDLEEMREGPYIPDMPDRVGVVTPTAGAGETMDGIGDTPGFQLLVRGEQNQPSSGLRLALQADRLIRFSPFPLTVPCGLRLLRVVRSGGGPAVLAMDDDADRVSATCTYLTEILR